METIETMLTKNNIAYIDNLNIKSLRKINKLMRLRDESHLYPINNRYNVTDRSINHYRRYLNNAIGCTTNLEYALTIENLISQYVNYGKVI